MHIYFAIGENDEYYDSLRIEATYETFCVFYRIKRLIDAYIGVFVVLDIKAIDNFNGDNQYGRGRKITFDEKING